MRRAAYTGALTLALLGSASDLALSQGGGGPSLFGNLTPGGSAPPPANAAPLNSAPAGAAPLNSAAPTNHAPATNAPGNTPAAGNAPAAVAPQGQAGPAAAAGKTAGVQGPQEMRFQFDQNGQPSMHTFILKWASPDANLTSIEILVSETNETLQTIKLPEGQVHLIWREVAENEHEIREKIVDSVDYNFDKYADLRVLRQWPYKVGQKYYLIWLFDDTRNQFVLNQELSALQGPVPNPHTKRVEATELTGSGGGEYIQRSYSVNPGGRLLVESKVTQSLLDPVHLTFLQDIRTRKEGELQRVCKLWVPTEGKPKRLWGKPDECAPFINKDPPSR